MAEPVNVGGELYQAGRADVRQQDAYKVKVSYNADFTTAASYSFDFSAARSNQSFTVARMMFIDNGANPSEVEVSVSQTDQYFTVPANAQGYFPIIATEASTIIISSVGGSADLATVVFYNYDMAGLVWYKFGTFNTNKPIMAEGTMNEGDAIAASTSNNPLYIGGKNYATGQFRAVSVDDNGFLTINNAASVLGSVNVKSSAAVDWLFSNTNTDTLASSATVNVPVTNSIARIANGANFARVIQVATALNSSGAGIQAVGLSGQLDDVTPTAITENNFGNLRISADRSLIVSPRATTGANSSVAGTVTASTTLLAANVSAKGRTIYNDSTATLYVAYGPTCTTTSFSYLVQPGGSLTVDYGYVGIITGVWSAAAGNARITELV